jgi:23S rRNA (cytidine1920-2'-O)/16S rRNA (cytidine1409-2'-O)-methyltransferase
MRVDRALAARGLARSRTHAQTLLNAGVVLLDGATVTRAATDIGEAQVLSLTTPQDGYVSRGALKLIGALDGFGGRGSDVSLVVAGRRCLDAGASTGGFTDVLLREGARQVVAVDVGYGQLAWRLRTDERVMVVDRTNVRTLTVERIGGPVELVVADLSFISLVLVLPALHTVSRTDADLVLMVKPQFEVGRERLGDGGVVRDPALRSQAVRKIADAAAQLGLGVAGVTASPLPGPAGNVEYFLWLRAGAPDLEPAALDRAVTEGPP